MCRFSRRRGKLCPGAGKAVCRRRGKVTFIHYRRKMCTFSRRQGRLCPGAGKAVSRRRRKVSRANSHAASRRRRALEQKNASVFGTSDTEHDMSSLLLGILAGIIGCPFAWKLLIPKRSCITFCKAKGRYCKLVLLKPATVVLSEISASMPWFSRSTSLA